MLGDIAGVVLWCLAVYVCAYDWSDMRASAQEQEAP